MKTMSLRLPASLHRWVRELSSKEGISMNQYIATAVAEKMSAQMTLSYLEERAERGDRDAFERVLAKVTAIEPDEEDRL